jgi:hypothetical protein
VYELSPLTIAMTVNLGESKSYAAFDSIFNEMSVSDSLNYSMFGAPKNCSYYDTLGEYQLLKSDKFETKIKRILNESYYIYGTKGIGKFKIKNVVFGLDECRTSIYAFTFDGFDTVLYGHPIICSPLYYELNYSKQYIVVEKKLASYSQKQVRDYSDNIPERVFANLGSIYFSYNDDFLWGKIPNLRKCQFPRRAIFTLNDDDTIVNLWSEGLDLFGIPCD